MKRLSISILAVIFSIGAAFSQPVSELGIIPVGVTLNSILRLNITSGGNLEYVVNTIGQYQAGIPAGSPYITTFNVASSVNFDVNLSADAANFIGVDDPNHQMPLDNLGFSMDSNGNGVQGTNWVFIADHTAVTQAAQAIIVGSIIAATPSAGGIDQNDFEIDWEFGTQAGGGATAMNTSSLLSQSLPADRYVVNVFLELVGK